MNNFDFDTWVKGSLSREFGHFSSILVWKYEHCPGLGLHGDVRVTYKDTLLPHLPGDDLPEWKPHTKTPDGKIITKPEGLIFMSPPFPSIADFPGIEPWGKHAEKSDAEGVRAAAKQRASSARRNAAAGVANAKKETKVCC